MHSTILAASLLALLFGPLAYARLNRQRKLSAVLDGFVFLSIGGIVLLEALPEAVHHGGLLAWIAIGALSGNLALSQIFTLLPATVAGGFLLARARRCENRAADRP